MSLPNNLALTQSIPTNILFLQDTCLRYFEIAKFLFQFLFEQFEPARPRS